MSTHTIKATRSGSHPTMGDWDQEYEITFRFIRHAPGAHAFGVMNPEPPDIEFVSISPGAGDHGAFSDIAQKWLEEWADGWLQDDGYDAACEIAASVVKPA